MNHLKTGKILTSLLTLGFLVFLSGCGSKDPTYKVSLEIWGPLGSNDAYAKIVSEYRKINPLVKEINYRKFTIDTYKKELIDALAAGQGPDIFLIQNNWLPYFKNKIEPAPEYLINEKQLRDNFVDVVVSDFLVDGKVYSVPLSVNSLALYWNKDLFNAEGITASPATWEEFQQDVGKLTKIDKFGNITQAGAALGTAYNINRSTDILGLLMMQKGAKMTDDRKTMAAFSQVISINGKSVNAGEEAMNFYTDFARSASPFYTWNTVMHYSTDSFSENNLAMMLNYSWHYETVKSKNSKLNFAVAPVPQFSGTPPLNYANYWSYVVAKNRPAVTNPQDKKLAPVDNNVRIHEAWQFLKFLTLQKSGQFTLINAISKGTKDFAVNFDPAKEYLGKTGEPAARRDIIEEQKNDPILGPFAYGNLIAKSWYETEPEAIEGNLAEAIDSVNRGGSTVSDALKLASARVSQLMRQ